MKFFGQNEFLPQNRIIKWLSKYGCELNEAEKYICENTVFVICGFDKKQYNATLMPVIFAHTPGNFLFHHLHSNTVKLCACKFLPAGTSTKTVVHYAQEIQESGNFQNFDYGPEENMKRYGNNTPPSYNLENISAPVVMFYAQNDWLAGYQDVKKLYTNIPAQAAQGLYKVELDEFNHVDFLWGIDASELVYKKMFEIMKNYE